MLDNLVECWHIDYYRNPDTQARTAPATERKVYDSRARSSRQYSCYCRRGSVQPARFAQSLAQQISERIPEFGPPLSRSQSRSVRSQDAETARRPSGVTATATTSPIWAWRGGDGVLPARFCARQSAVFASQTSSVWG